MKLTPSNIEPLHLRFVGNEMKPEKVSSKELAELISAYETSIVSTLFKTNHNEINEDVFISLVEIKERSLGLGFKPKILALALTAQTITNSLSSGDYSQLPIKAIESLQSIHNFCKKNRCVAEFTNGSSEFPTAVISPESVIEIPREFYIEGETVIYGKLERVGGVEPKIRIRNDNGNLVFIDVQESDAKFLANSLYEDVAVKGVATWRRETFQLESFKFESIIPFQQEPISSTISELKILIGSHWDMISDHEAYILEQRYS